jgi:hypothetical protein
MKKNEHYLIGGGGTATWQFYIDSEISLSNDIQDRTATIAERVFAAVTDVIIPIELTIGAASIPTETPIEDAFREAEPVSDSQFVLKDEDGIEFEQYEKKVASISADDNRVLHISKIATEATKVQVFLRNGMQTISAGTSEYFKNENPDVDKGLDYAPLNFSITHHGSRHAPKGELKGQSVYRVVLRTNSDVWFDDTTFARINRARLSEIFYNINSSLPVVALKFSADDLKGYTDTDVAGVFEYGGPPANELIKDYRVNWVQSELVETASQYEEGGETIFEVTSDAESILTDELRRRIEAYVEQQRELGNAPQADRLRIVRTDGTPLEAMFTDSGLEWTDDVVQ